MAATSRLLLHQLFLLTLIFLYLPLQSFSFFVECISARLIQRSEEESPLSSIVDPYKSMAPNLNPAFAYTVVYVRDVAKSVAFYSNAFGYDVRRLDQSHRWGELESGKTTIAFTPIHQKETERSGEVQIPAGKDVKQPVEICFGFADVDAAYKTAVENGAVPVSPPEDKPWGQRVGYVRDIDGIVVRLGSHVKEPSSTL